MFQARLNQDTIRVVEPEPFIAAVYEARRELERVKAELSRFDELNMRRMNLEQFINAAQQLLGSRQYDLLPALVSAGQIVQSHPPELKEIREDRLWEYILFAFKSIQSPLTAGEVLELLTSEGVTVRGEHKRETVRTAMVRKEDLFERVSRGIFALREWPAHLKYSRNAERVADEDANE